jgi:hypothetical protein
MFQSRILPGTSVKSQLGLKWASLALHKGLTPGILGSSSQGIEDGHVETTNGESAPLTQKCASL